MPDTDVEQHNPKVDRLRVLEAVYESLGDDTMSSVRGAEIREELELSDDRAANAMKYLEDDGLLNAIWTYGDRTPMSVRITHLGVKLMEAAKEKPAESATDGLSPYNVITNNVTIHHADSSGIQIGTVASTQHNTFTINDVDKLRELVARIESQLPQLREELGDEAASDLESDMALVQGQLDLPKRKDHVIRACLGSIKAILEGAGGNLAASGILDLLGQIHF
jgi:DNA-binding MarR family transcriptional regulator